MKVVISVVHFVPNEVLELPENAEVIQIIETGSHIYLAWILQREEK